MSDQDSTKLLNLEWSEWIPLNSGGDYFTQIPTTPGVYRITVRQSDGLAYIGQSSNLQSRVKTHRACHSTTKPDQWPASILWDLRQEYNSKVVISYATPEGSADSRIRRSIEAALIASYRRNQGESPTCNFGKRATDSIPPVEWSKVNDITSNSWMGLEWSEPEALADLIPNTSLDESVPAQPGPYRLWWPEDQPPLAKIGQAFRLRRRLHEHRRSKDGNLLFSYARIHRRDGGYESYKRREIETDLLGAHWIACRQPPHLLEGRKQ